MMNKVLCTLVFASALTASAAYAHDASLHKGKPTVGKVVALSQNGVSLKTAKGDTMVTFQDNTKFERGNAQASSEDIQTGDQLTVFGTKLPNGELVAREVLLPAQTAKEDASSAHSAHRANKQ